MIYLKIAEIAKSVTTQPPLMIYLLFVKILSIVSSAVPILFVICFVNLPKILIIWNESEKNLKLVGKSTFLKTFLRNSSFLVPMKVKNTIKVE